MRLADRSESGHKVSPVFDSYIELHERRYVRLQFCYEDYHEFPDEVYLLGRAVVVLHDYRGSILLHYFITFWYRVLK
jgi:hypothetical protein